MMIRTACLAMIAAGSMFAAPASAAVSINGRISEIVSRLQTNATFTPNNFSFSVNGQHLFTGIGGVRALNDLNRIEQLFNDGPAFDVQPSGYKFTHSALGSVFNAPQGQSAPQGSNAPQFGAPPVLDVEPQGGSHKFTHDVLDSYFDQPSGEPDCDDPHTIIEPPVVTAPVPEPATWAMMVGGLGVVGLSMRRRRTELSFV